MKICGDEKITPDYVIASFSISGRWQTQMSFMLPQQQLKHHRVKFTEAEDQIMCMLIAQTGTDNWQLIAQRMGNRTARQCRDRWKHYLSPTANSKEWDEEEDKLLFENYEKIGPHWGKLASLFPGRTSIGVRNRCTKLKRIHESNQKKMQQQKERLMNSSSNSCSSESDSEEKARSLLPPISTLPFQAPPAYPNSFFLPSTIFPINVAPSCNI